LDYRFYRFANKIGASAGGVHVHDPTTLHNQQEVIGIMHDRSSIELIHQTTRTRRMAIALILLALALPSLFAWSDNVPLESAGAFTGQLAAVTLLAMIARLWIARHYSAGVQVQVLLAFALVLIGWSGYVSRHAHDERVAAAAQPASSTPSRIPGQVEPVDSKLEGTQR
jgi:4-amino-4-deoxy-L-arabinose transferase-like glycosyltransferase